MLIAQAYPMPCWDAPTLADESHSEPPTKGAGCTADARRTSRLRHSAGQLTPPRSATHAEPPFCRTCPSAVAVPPDNQPLQVVFTPLSGRTDAHTERVIMGDNKLLIAIIIDKYFYNHVSFRAMQPKGWTQAAPDKGAHLYTLHRVRLFWKMVVNS